MTVTTASWLVPDIRYSGAMWSAISEAPSVPESAGFQADQGTEELPFDSVVRITTATATAPIASPISSARAARNFPA